MTPLRVLVPCLVLGVVLVGCTAAPRTSAATLMTPAAPTAPTAPTTPPAAPTSPAAVTGTHVVAQAQHTQPEPSPARPGTPGAVARPVATVHLEVFEWFNVLQVVDDSDRIVRTIKISGNPDVAKPDECVTQGRVLVNWDYTYQWKLDYFTRLCAGRGIGTHAIPLDARTGAPSMDAADLGRAPEDGAPLSHGCLRMSTADAKYVYDNFADGVPVYFVRTPRAG